MITSRLTGILSSLVILSGSTLLLAPGASGGEIPGCTIEQLREAIDVMEQLGICKANVSCSDENTITLTDIEPC